MNEKPLTLQDITMEDVYRYLYCANHCNEPTFCESQVDELFPKKPYYIEVITDTDIQYCMNHNHYTIPTKTINLNKYAEALLTLLTNAEIIQHKIIKKLHNMYKNYVPILQLQMDLEHVLKHDVFYAPFDAETVYDIKNPISFFAKEVNQLDGTGKKGQYYDDTWDEYTFAKKVQQYKDMSLELFQDKEKLCIPKQGKIQEIQHLLYQLQQSLPSLTGMQTHRLRQLCFPYNNESVVFALYNNLNDYITNTDDTTIADYLWYFVSHHDEYRYIAKYMESHIVFKLLQSIHKHTNVENGFDLLHTLSKYENEIYPFLQHLDVYWSQNLVYNEEDDYEDFDFDGKDPSEIEKLFEESVSEEEIPEALLDENFFAAPPHGINKSVLNTEEQEPVETPMKEPTTNK